MKHYDIAIIGGGIIGLSTAYSLLNSNPGLKLALLEKEDQIAKHQSGHNSGVIHSGIYYKKDSLKAKNCVRGVKMLLEFCNKHHIPYELCGKVIVATSTDELPRLEGLYKRGLANGVEGLKLIDKAELKKIEPHAQGIQAIYSPNTGIVDYKKVAQKLLEKIKDMGASIYLSSKVLKITETPTEIIINTAQSEVLTERLINCCGLHADTVASMTKTTFKEKIIPFRGEYYFLSQEAAPMLKGLIYPVPNPKFPFLGVHLTRRITGEVEAGPNAVLALAKEGYKKGEFNAKELASSLGYRGFWAMAARHWKTGLYELYRSYSKRAFLKDLQRLMPELEEKHLSTGGSGVRAQTVSPSGQIIDDFLITSTERILNVLNAPSPGATSSLSIAEHLRSIINLKECKTLN